MSESHNQKRKLIAEGFSGKIYLTKIQKLDGTSSKAVIKKFNLKCKQHYQTEKEIFNEINPHQLFPQVFFYNDEQSEICMEYCRGGTLFDTLSKCGRFEEELVFRYFKQILEALRHLKRHSICHRDIKLENILIQRDDKRYLKMVDLSFCARITKAKSSVDRRCFKDQVGTEGYQCPEMLKGQLYSGYEADMFSLGVVLFEMVHGKPPFLAASKEHCEFYGLFCDNRKQYWNLFESLAPNKSPHLVQLIEQLLEADPDKRIALGKVFRTPWFKELDKKMVSERNIGMQETQIDFGHYKQACVDYNKSNFLTFLSRVFQNNVLYSSLSKIKNQQKQNNQQTMKKKEDNNKIDRFLKNQRIIEQQINTLNEQNFKTQIFNPENNKIDEQQDQIMQNLSQTHNGVLNVKFDDPYMEQDYILPINRITKIDSQKAMSLSPEKARRNPQQNLISNILKTKVLYYDHDEAKNPSSDEGENNYDFRQRLNTESSNIRPKNIFKIIRQYCQDDINLRMSYMRVFSKPVDIKQIKEKYSKQYRLPQNINKIMTNNNFANLAGYNF